MSAHMVSYLYLCKDRRVIHHYLSGLIFFPFLGGYAYYMYVYICKSVFTDHTLAHPLNFRGGVVARLSA